MKTRKSTLAALAFLLWAGANAQPNDQTTNISIGQTANNLNGQALAGQWQFVASPFMGGEERIAFTATLSDDGSSLNCHSDNFFAHSSKPYPADWQIAIEHDGDKVRLGWVLDSSTPCSAEEFQEPATAYALFGTDADGSHRYIYFLSENIETQQLEDMTLWSDWQTDANAAFTLPKTQQLYAVASKNKPYSGAVGYIDIWASGKLLRTTTGAAIHDITGASVTVAGHSIYSLTGQRMAHPAKGLYIKGGKKYLKH